MEPEVCLRILTRVASVWTFPAVNSSAECSARPLVTSATPPRCALSAFGVDRLICRNVHSSVVCWHCYPRGKRRKTEWTSEKDRKLLKWRQILRANVAGRHVTRLIDTVYVCVCVCVCVWRMHHCFEINSVERSPSRESKGAQLVKKFHAFKRSHRCIPVFTRS
jgi:hypothetical protein